MPQKRPFRILEITILFIIMAILYTYLPWHYGYIYSGDDLLFHLERLEEAYLNIKSHHFFVSEINTFSFSEFGQAINAFYPWGNLLPYALIRMFLHNPINSYYTYLTLEQFLGLIFAYISAKIITRSTSKSLIFTVLLRFSSVILFNDFSRADIGESWAFIFVPLTFTGLYLILIKSNFNMGTLLLSLGLTFEIYCHIMVSFLSVLIMILLEIIWLYYGKPSTLRLGRVLKAEALGTIIFTLNSLAILVPILTFKNSTQLIWPDKKFFITRQINLNSVIEGSLNNNLSTLNIGILGLVVIIICLIQFKSFSRLNKICFIFGILLLVIGTNAFPWYLFRNTAVASIQFAWRLIPFSILFIIFSFANSLQLKLSTLTLVILFTIVFASGALTNYITSKNNNYSKDDTYSFQHPYGKNIDKKIYKRSLTYYYYNKDSYHMDYIPKKTYKSKNFNSYNVYDHMAIINGRKTYLSSKELHPIYQGMTYKFNSSSKIHTVELPFLIYNSNFYKVTVNDKPYKTIITENQLPLVSKKTDSIRKVTIQYVTPSLFIIVRFISLISILISFFLIFLMDKKF
ncbi:hypothetical protein ACLUWJ_06330 [Limosilactobacillus mucosae]|uniref:hypothetical protein n=1 Tax=Limosilactobacillus mucosae TaxID=97478 RepID=UPI00399489A4